MRVKTSLGYANGSIPRRRQDSMTVEIDNNKIENAIRPTAVGKKNWLLIGEAEAGDRSAIVFRSTPSPSPDASSIRA